MLKPVPDYAQQIDAKTRGLMLEFFDHVREVTTPFAVERI